MRYRTLGSTGITVSEIGFGTWAIGGNHQGMVAYGPTDDQESLWALDEALALGCTFFDTSNLYGWGHAETLLGKAFAHRRDQVVLATKAGFVTPEGAQDFSPAAVRRSLEGSLRRLGTGYVDVLQLHNPSATELTAGHPLLTELDTLRKEGLVRAWGISASSPEDALLFARHLNPAFLQVNFNLGDMRAWENGLFELARTSGIGLVIRTPLAAGFLTGRLDTTTDFAESDRRRRIAPEVREKWVEAVRRMEPAFQDVPSATPAQNAIRFCLSFGAVSTVIPGMTVRSDVQEDLGTAALPLLGGNQVHTIQQVYQQLFG